MSAYGRTFFEFCAMPALAGHLGETQPAWLWSADGRRVLWANAAGVRFFRAASMAELLGRSLADTAPARRHLERLAHAPQERESLEKLRFFIGVRAVQLTAHARAVTLENGEQAALVVATDTRLDIEDPLADFCRLIAGEGYSAFLTDEDGKVLASAGATEPGDIALEEADDEVDVRVRIADDLHAAQMAQLSEPAPAACLILAEDAASEIAQPASPEPGSPEPENLEPETPEPESATEEKLDDEPEPEQMPEPVSEVEGVEAGSEELTPDEPELEEAELEETGPEEIELEEIEPEEVGEPVAADEPAEPDMPIEIEPETEIEPKAEIVAQAETETEAEDESEPENELEPEAEPEIVPMRAHAIPGEETEAVATSSFPRNFFPWPRFLKGRANTQAAVAEEPPVRAELSGPAAALIAEARAAKQTLIDREHEEDYARTELFVEEIEVPQAADIVEDVAVLEDDPEELRAAQEEAEADVFAAPVADEVEAASDALAQADVFAGEAETAEPEPDAVSSEAEDEAEDEDDGVADVFAAPASQAEPAEAAPGDGDDVSSEADREDMESDDSLAPESPAASEAEPAPAFAFDSDGRPVRFVWQMNASHVFTGVSPELAHVIGAEAADIVGRSWPEVAERLDLDPEGRVAAALSRRDTWSGLTVEWPVTDNPVVVPVDLAALPAFDRFRQFEGYRGFGVCRPADAVTMERMHPLPSAADAEEEEHAPEDDTTARDLATGEPEAGPETPLADTGETEAPAVEGLTDEVETSARSEAVTIAASAAAVIAGAGLLAGADEEEPQGEAAEENAEPESVAEEGVEDTDTAHEEPSVEAKAPETGNVTDLPKLAKPAPAYTHYAPAADPMPAWGLPEAANSQDLSESSEPAEAESAGPVDEAASESAATATGDAEDVIEEVADEAEIKAEAVEAEPAGIVEPETAPEPEPEAEPEPEVEAEPAPEAEPTPEAVSEAEPESEPKTTASLAGSAVAAAGIGALAATVADDAETVDEAPGEDDAVGMEDEPSQEEEPFLPMEGMPASMLESAPVAETAAADDEVEEIPAEAVEVAADEADVAEPEPETVAEAEAAEGDESFTETVVRLAERQVIPPDSQLTRPEREAFRKIAEALGARIDETNKPSDDDEEEVAAKAVPPIPMPIAPRPQPREPVKREETAEEKAAAIHPRLLDRLPIGVAIVRDRDVEYANRSLLKMLGYSDLEALAEAGGLEALFASPDEWPPKPAGSATIEQSLCVRASDGALHPVDAFMHTVPWKTGSGLMISLREKSDAPKAKAAPIGEAEGTSEKVAELEAILETATDGVMVLDANGRILSVNRSGEALFNASRQRMTGALLTDYLALESHRSALDYLDGLARNGVASVLNDGREVIGQLSDGGLIPLFMTIGRIGQHTNAENTKFCAVLRDITQWKKAEEELTSAKRQAENASSQKSDFLAKISHEIRTPLNAIIGFSEVMMDERFGAVGNERYKDYLKDIHASGSHLLSLINDLLDLSKVEAGKFELAFEAVPINDVLRDCVALMQPQANRDRVIIRASLPTSVPKVVADPRSVRQIVLNLLSNAIKFNQAGGQVIVSTALEPSGEVVLRVRDTGMGMSRKDIEAALEPFRQLHTARLGGGTGLGLPLTKALVEANRAGFSIDSEPNQGTMVEITFPSQRVLAE
ncbi:PAS domain-containing sensor histidine kinase [Breoghania sp.]|uniref:PAS domain-containing sensor histidine kinase n=1 Tax=Breoghania sp. TaxID=2065378 RepID=UPI002AA6A021|nr:PAS domain-containing sensor histidine kinase [Breoghania sp.]